MRLSTLLAFAALAHLSQAQLWLPFSELGKILKTISNPVSQNSAPNPDDITLSTSISVTKPSPTATKESPLTHFGRQVIEFGQNLLPAQALPFTPGFKIVEPSKPLIKQPLQKFTPWGSIVTIPTLPTETTEKTTTTKRRTTTTSTATTKPPTTKMVQTTVPTVASSSQQIFTAPPYPVPVRPQWPSPFRPRQPSRIAAKPVSLPPATTLKPKDTCEPGQRCQLKLKSYETSQPVFQYAYSQSSRLEEPLRTILRKTQEKSIEAPLTWKATISPEVVQLSMNLMRLYRPNRSLVVGVFTGLGLVGIAKATDPEGMVFALEYPEYMQYWESIGGLYAIEHDLLRRIQMRAGTSIRASLGQLSQSEPASFDFILLDDAHQGNYDIDYELCLKLLRTGGLMVISDALVEGRVLSAEQYKAPATKVVDKLNAKLQRDGRVRATFLPYGGGTVLVIKK